MSCMMLVGPPLKIQFLKSTENSLLVSNSVHTSFWTMEPKHLTVRNKIRKDKKCKEHIFEWIGTEVSQTSKSHYLQLVKSLQISWYSKSLFGSCVNIWFVCVSYLISPGLHWHLTHDITWNVCIMRGLRVDRLVNITLTQPIESGFQKVWQMFSETYLLISQLMIDCSIVIMLYVFYKDNLSVKPWLSKKTIAMI